MIWDWWNVETKGQYAATLLALFVAVVLYRYLVRLELAFVRRTAAGGAGAGVGAAVGNVELGAWHVGGCSVQSTVDRLD